MLIYRFDTLPSCSGVSYSMDPYAGKIAGKEKPSTIISASEPVTIRDNDYIYDMGTGRFYMHNASQIKTTISAEAVLIPRCTMGISVYDKSGDNKKEVTHLERGGRMCLTLDFNTDKNGNIWAKMYTLDDSYRKVQNEGYIIYKNQRNNFANVSFTDSTLETVLTRGEVDSEKIMRIKSGEASVNKPMTLRATKAQTKKPQTLFPVAQIPIKPLIPNPKLPSTSIPEPNFVGGGATTSMPTNPFGSVSNVVHDDDIEHYSFNRIYTYNASENNKRYMDAIEKEGPAVMTNLAGFPPTKQFVNGHWEYDYSLNYRNGLGDLTDIYKDYNMNIRTIADNTKANITKYNRFKLANPDDILSRGFMHIFMTRPDLNFFNDSAGNLRSEVKSDPFLAYVRQKNPLLVKQLVELNGQNHQFMMLLSNKAKGFQLSDDGINHDTYGKSRKGYSVAYGRRRDSELGGSMNIAYRDTRDLDILNLHKIWVDYIINVYSGKWTPKMKYIQDKILDYAVAIYVIVTAEDFETILFWSKYYGVFPVSLPFSAISWDGERSTVGAPDLQITYAYAWKEDLNPAALAELNMNSFKRGIPKYAYYVPTYNARLATINNTWVGPPFVELIKYPTDKLDLTNGSGIALKLRFARV